MSCTIPPNPRFEIGERYKTRDGRIANVEARGSDYFRLRGSVDGNFHSWTDDGRWTDAAHDLDLMPGAIEDEKTEAIEVECQQRQIDILRKEIAAQANVIAGMAAKIEQQEGTIANLNKKIDLTHDDLSRQSRGHSRITADLGAKIEQLQERAKPNGKTASELTADDFRRFDGAHTIKGGWVNVFGKDANGCMVIGNIHPTAERAAFRDPDRSRIACIQIPDITEGEGL